MTPHTATAARPAPVNLLNTGEIAKAAAGAPPAAPNTPADHGSSVLSTLLDRMQAQGDFPALSQSISTINRIVATSDESIQTLSAALLKDFALTNKVLRLVNSATYGRYGGTISTISRAVMILGFNTVRSLAVTLTLFEHLQKNARSAHLKDQLLSAYLTGILSCRIATASGIPDSEEGFICGVFHSLGRVIATYYFNDETRAIESRLQSHESEDKAARAVLGISFEELGIGVARYWQLPEKIVNSIPQITPSQIPKTPTPADKLKLVANLATEMCRVAGECPAERRHAELEKLRKAFGTGLNLAKTQLSEVFDSTTRQFLAESDLFVADTGKSPLLGTLRRQLGFAGTDTSDDPPAPPEATQAQQDNDAIGAPAGETPAPIALDIVVDSVNRNTALAAGIQDITNALVGEYNLNTLLCTIVETMYRSMGFSQVILCTRDVRLPELKGRLGFGAGTDDLLKHFRVPIGEAQDVFQLALNKNADIFIADTRSDSVASRIPAWYRDKVHARAFLLLPIVINKKIFGMFYADYNDTDDSTIEPNILQMLKTLRNQAILAIRQQS